MSNRSVARFFRKRLAVRGSLISVLVAAFPLAATAANDAYVPPADSGAYEQSPSPAPSDDSYRADEIKPAPVETYEPVRPLDGSRRDGARAPAPSSDPGGYGEPYGGAPEGSRAERYEDVPPESQGGPPESDSRYYSQNEIIRAGHGFFGSVSGNLASAVEWAFQKAGRPNGYILGQDAGGAIVAGLRYGEGTLQTKDRGSHKVYWQGPTIGYDFGAEGSKVMVLVYNLSDPSEIYNRFGGVQGAAYLVGGVSVQIQKAGEVTLAPIRSGLGVRLGANVGYLKYTRNPTWNPF